MRRREALVLAMTALLASGLIATPATAVDDLLLNVAGGSEFVQPGDTVTVTLDAANLSADINGVQVLLQYDTAIMMLVDVAPTDLLVAGLIGPPADGWVEIALTDTAGDVDWAAVIHEGSIAVDHTIATLTFMVLIEGTTNVAFRPDAPPFYTKLTLASDSSTVFPNVTDSGSIVSDCDDGLFCNGAETFVVDVCQPGTDPCDDGIGCTVDTCDEVLDSCASVPTDGLCDNGFFCDGPETCDPVLDCQPDTIDPCDDGVGCTADVCDDGADTCTNTPEDLPCDDGAFCNGTETCDALLDCQPGTDPCTPLMCDEVNDACFAPMNVAGLEVYYAGRFVDAPDPSHWFVASGSPATVDNITNYVRGITGIRVIFNDLVQFTTTPRDAFSFEWTTGTGIIFSPVTNPGNITVVADDGSGVTIVTVVLADDYVLRRWLKVTIDATQVTASGVELDGELIGNPTQFPSGDTIPGGDAVFHLGNITGDVNFDRKTTLTDIGLIRFMVNPFLPVLITNLYDVNKDGKVLLGDVGDARPDVNPFFALPLFTP